jgi:beta-alanine--pyruvate transaminase
LSNINSAATGAQPPISLALVDKMTSSLMSNPLNKDNSLAQFWMPFTANRQFKAKPRLLESAAGMYYTSSDGRQVLDGTAGLWCCNAGHGRREITEAVSQKIAKLDFAPTFQMGHPLPF